MKTVTLEEYYDAMAQIPWGVTGPRGELPIALIPVSAVRQTVGRRPITTAPRTPARRLSSSSAYEARCPKCSALAAVGRDEVLCYRTAGGCGATTALKPSQQAARLRHDLAARGA
jgi:hypothetical protein